MRSISFLYDGKSLERDRQIKKLIFSLPILFYHSNNYYGLPYLTSFFETKDYIFETQYCIVIIFTWHPLSILIELLFADNRHGTSLFIDFINCVTPFILREDFESRFSISIREFLGF